MTHEDLNNAIQALKDRPEMTRAELSDVIGRGTHSSFNHMVAAITLTVRVLVMVDCSALHRSSDRLESGYPRAHWRDKIAFSEYLEALFPRQHYPVVSSSENDLSVEIKAALNATELKKYLDVALQGTNS